MSEYDGDIYRDFNEKNILTYVWENVPFLSSQVITYLGNKRHLSNLIRKGINEVQTRLNKNKLSILDGFSGSGYVSRLLKAYSSELHTNDLELYSKIINQCYLSNISDISIDEISDVVSFLNSNKLRDDYEIGFIEDMYSPKNDEDIKEEERVFFTRKNARIIDNMRRMVNNIDNSYLYIAPLLYEASVKTNTSGVFKGFYRNSKTGIGQFGGDDKNCINRIKSEINLQIPVFSEYNCPVFIYQEDINDLIKNIVEVDLAYFDPPYNQHPYSSNYFMLNLICQYDRPQRISKVSGIPQEWNRSQYNTKKAKDFLRNLIENTKSKFILLSYNDEGIINIEDIASMISEFGRVSILEENYVVFRASRNLQNRSNKVKEYLFILEK